MGKVCFDLLTSALNNYKLYVKWGSLALWVWWRLDGHLAEIYSTFQKNPTFTHGYAWAHC